MAIALNENMLLMVLDFYPDWGHSAERFFEFIRALAAVSRLYEAENEKKYASADPADEEQIAAVFKNVFGLDLRPYDSYAAWAQQSPDFNFPVELRRMQQQSHMEDMERDMMEVPGVRPSIETILEEGFKEYQKREIVEKLRPYILFR